ncbi:uncharacterized protein TNCV_1682321 [Trichonephila clavipes]|nr:uncharacterized protein TNCV_1682321 [Trichonephila clavipes]
MDNRPSVNLFFAVPTMYSKLVQVFEQVGMSENQARKQCLNSMRWVILKPLKKSRKTERAAFTKACNRVEKLIALEGVEICKLEAELNVFKGKVDHLKNTHSNIVELLPEKDYDTEFEIVEYFWDKAI